MKRLCFLPVLFFMVITVIAQDPFTLVNTGIFQAGDSYAAWCDYDLDGDLDIALTGDNGGYPVTKIFRNDAGTFTELQATLPGLNFSSCEWGDYEPDGDFDLLITGDDHEGIPRTKIIRNNGGTFAESGILFPGVSEGQASWGDYDNDQDLDILLVGEGVAVIYRNDGNDIFTDIPAPLLPVWGAFCNWVDYNNDGMLDAMIGGDCLNGDTTILYRNDNGTFIPVTVGPEPFTGLSYGHAAWGDLNLDNRMDLIVTGVDDSGDGHILIYKNEGNDQFSVISNYDFQILVSSVSIGDYDADGLSDWILMGGIPGCGGTAITMLYHNEGFMTFFDVSTTIPGLKIGSASFGDYNGDGFSDLLITGMNGYNEPKTLLYRNNAGNEGFTMNTPPNQPAGLIAVADGNDLLLKWQRATDAQTPPPGLSYNIFIGTLPESPDVFPPMADLTSGFRHVAAMGNTGQDTIWRIKDLTEGEYFWSVQTIDNGYIPSLFSPVENFYFIPVGIDAPGKERMTLSPNPATDRLRISGETVLWVEIYNTSSRLVWQGASSGIDISDLPAGLYLVKIRTSGHCLLEKFVKL